MPFAFAAAPRPVTNRLALKTHRRSLWRLTPTSARPQPSPSRHSIPISDRSAPSELDQPNRPRHNRQPHYPHSARRPTERTCPAVSSPEASRTPAAQAGGIVPHAAGVREPLTNCEVGALQWDVRFALQMRRAEAVRPRNQYQGGGRPRYLSLNRREQVGPRTTCTKRQRGTSQKGSPLRQAIEGLAF
jgi:hypothetical protein